MYQEFHDTGIDIEYTFIWYEYQQDVKTPSFVLVTVNANSGKVIEYVGLLRDVNVSLKPVVSNNRAIEIASDYFDTSPLDVEFIELKIINLDLTDQRLVWEIVIHCKPVENIIQGGRIQIDAENGKILRVFKWL